MTTTETPAGTDVSRYLADVADHLSALPWLAEADRAELLDDLAQHLAEVAAEDGPPLAERLGPPAAYAEELLAAAGLETPHDGPLAGLRARAAVVAWWHRARRTLDSAGDLEPAWWVVRGYLAASLLGALSSGYEGGHPGFPIPAVAESPVLGLLAVVAAVKLSVRWGRQGRPARRWVRRLATAGLGVYALVLLVQLGHPRTEVQWINTGPDQAPGGCLTNGAGQVIENLYPYDAEGRLLDRVLLFDQTGRPLDNLCPSRFDHQGRPVVTEYGRDENGAAVINVFPRRQTVSDFPGPSEGPEDPSLGPVTTTGGTGPVAPPAVVIPRLGTTTTTTSAPPAPPSTTAPPAPPDTTVPASPPAAGN